MIDDQFDHHLHIALMRRSDAHIYLTYPFVASWSMREALAIGCPVIGSDTDPVREFITHGENGLLTPFLEPRTLARTILGLVEDKSLTRKLRENARAYAERHLAMADYLDTYCRVIGRLTGENPVPSVDAAPPPGISRVVRRRTPSTGAAVAPRPLAAAAYSG